MTVALDMLFTVGCMSREESGLNESSEAPGHTTSSAIAETPNTALQQKRIEYRDSTREVIEVLRQRYMQGTDSIDQLIAAQVALSDAELAISSIKEERVTILEASLNKLKELEQYQQARIEVGAGRTDELVKAKAGRILGEILLLEESHRDE